MATPAIQGLGRFLAGVCANKPCFVGTEQTRSSAQNVRLSAWVFLAQNEDFFPGLDDAERLKPSRLRDQRGVHQGQSDQALNCLATGIEPVAFSFAAWAFGSRHYRQRLPTARYAPGQPSGPASLLRGVVLRTEAVLLRLGTARTARHSHEAYENDGQDSLLTCPLLRLSSA
jgi:hypothetical protein